MSSPPLNSFGGPIVSLQAVHKIYRLYQKPVYRFLDLFGLCPEDSNYFKEHEALADVDLTIARGEKVAIIGRNGAGKSTLLKIITGLVQPTSGVVDVRARISNLLQLGSGFHPDFTGRQNVFAGLAHQGIIGAQAAKLFNDIVDFSEIEEYIDQPMKTYSTGMCSRLMFASSVVMSPEILVVDEILGVGDAYFSHKSFGRMRELCSNDGTTLLLVTHDIYSALNLCDRFIWIDRGRIRFDGDGKGAIALYEASVKEQEEQALRQQNAANLRAEPTDPIVHVVLRSQTGFALSRPLALGTLEISDSGGGSLLLNVADGDPRWHLVAESNLGDPELVDGVRARSLRTFGSIYHKAEWTVQLPDGFEIARVRVRWRHQGGESIELRVISTRQDVIVRGELAPGDRWQEAVFGRAQAGRRDANLLKQVDYGTGAIRITAVEFLDQDGRSITQVKHRDSLTIRIHCRSFTTVRENAVTFCIGFARQGSAYQLYIYDPHLVLPDTDEFVIDSHVDDVRLGSGVWYVNLGVGAADMFKRTTLPYFSLDSDWYHLMSARLQFQVLSATQFDANGCFFWMPAAIAVSPVGDTGGDKGVGLPSTVEVHRR